MRPGSRLHINKSEARGNAFSTDGEAIWATKARPACEGIFTQPGGFFY
jgi:hypothetical protein